MIYFLLNADENTSGISSAKDLVMFLALKKCQYCLEHNDIDKNSLIISADTVVYCDKVLGKPESKDDARKMIESISGRTHSVYTGVAIYDAISERFDVFYDRSNVNVKRSLRSKLKNIYKVTNHTIKQVHTLFRALLDSI